MLTAGFPADQVIASWNLRTGRNASIEIQARGDDGRWHPWRAVAEWGPAGSRRSASAAGSDETIDASAPQMDTDVLVAADGTAFDAVRLRILLDAEQESEPAADALTLAAVSFSAVDDRPHGEDSAPGDDLAPTAIAGAAARVHPLTQRAYPARDDLGGGGPVWCSPTSLTMVLAAWGARIPEAPDDAPGDADAHVPWVAREAFDTRYDGTGNWSFNVAVAGALGFDAVVTRLRSLDDAHVLTRAGIPLVTSIRFDDRSELAGADYEAPTGHLVVLRGLTDDGDVLVADPANPGGDAGLRTYRRAEFDRVWSRSRRTAYVVTPRGHPLPAVSGDARW